MIKLTDVIKVWEELHAKNTGDLAYFDLEKAMEKVVGIKDDINLCQPKKEK